MSVRLGIEGGELVATMTGADAFWAFKRSVRVPLANVVGAAQDSTRDWLGGRRPDTKLGIRVLGTGIPYYLVAGRFRRLREPKTKTFCCIHRRDPGVVVIALRDERWDRLVFGVPDPTTTVSLVPATNSGGGRAPAGGR